MDRLKAADLVRPHVAGLAPYTPIVPFEVLSQQMGRPAGQIVKLDANENPYGPAPAVREALARYPYMHIYPDPEQRALRAALADYTGVPASSILPGHGADELIDLLCRVFLGSGDALIDCPPTFGMYGFDAGLAGASVIRVPRDRNYRVDVSAIHDALAGGAGGARGKTGAAKLLFLTSPNNPDGSLLDPDDLARLLPLPMMVVVDEAYVEFAGLTHSFATQVLEHENLIVLRTFSKWAGIAGLRLGYGIFPGWLMPILWRVKQPYNVNVAATIAGLESLAHRDEIQPTVDALAAERDRLFIELGRFSFLEPCPSRANFVLCRVIGRNAAALKSELEEQGILVRHYAKPGLENCIRVSAGRPQDTDTLLAALRNLEAERV
jgi:histidinol-phosphate aminotransferase